MNYDVIVVGFGTAGAMAAIAAGRKGAKTLVLEQCSYPGGLQTGGFITEYFLQPPTGLAAEMEDEARQLLETSKAYASSEEPKKITLERNALSAGVEIHYEIRLVKVMMEGRRICGVEWTENGEIFKAFAKVVIDATAEAEVALLAGCEFSSGRPWDGKFQHSADIFKCLKGQKYGYTGTSLRVNQGDVGEYSAAFLKATAEILQENKLGQRLSAPSDRAGLREGRHIIPEKRFSLEDFLLEKEEIEEPVAYAYSALDTNITDFAFESEPFQDWMIVAGMWGVKLWFPIPRRALIPRDVEGLLVAGRHLGVDHDLGHALRMNSAMGSIGESAGVIAALAAKTGAPLNEVEFQIPKPDCSNDKVWSLSDDEIVKSLESDFPGKGIWTSYRSGKVELLRKCFERGAPGSTLRTHALFALALLKDRSVVEALRELAGRRDSSKMFSPANPKDDVLASPPRSCVALYLLGRFRDKGSLRLFADVLQERDLDFKFEYQTVALCALVKSGEAHRECRSEISRTIQAALDNPEWLLQAKPLKYLTTLQRADREIKATLKGKLEEFRA